ncbi:hypothetical protein GQ457_02G033250 [Hibiscus cannabinus]
MQKLGKEELKVDLSRGTCGRARRWALEEISGRVLYEFTRLFDYAYALRQANPTANIELMVERPTPFETPKFRRFYVGFTTLRDGLKKCCRPFLCLDGCFLKGKFNGEILTAVGRDGNYQIYPIAWAIVEVENRETWSWFLRNIIFDLQLGDGDGFTLMTDQQKGLKEEIVELLPRVEHRVCARHLYAIWRKENLGGDLKKEFWAACKSTTDADFEHHISKIEQLKATAKESLMKTDPKQWSKSCFSTRSDCDATDNNFVEAFNIAIIGARTWDLTGIPCAHAIAAILWKKDDVNEYVYRGYKKEMYQMLYSHVFPVVPSEKFWVKTKMGPIDPPLPRKIPGRPKRNRVREEGASASTTPFTANATTEETTQTVVQAASYTSNEAAAHVVTQTHATPQAQLHQDQGLFTAYKVYSRPTTPSNVASTPTVNQKQLFAPSTQLTPSTNEILTRLSRRGQRIVNRLGLYTDERTGMQILNPGFSGETVVTIPRKCTRKRKETNNNNAISIGQES